MQFSILLFIIDYINHNYFKAYLITPPITTSSVSVLLLAFFIQSCCWVWLLLDECLSLYIKSFGRSGLSHSPERFRLVFWQAQSGSWLKAVLYLWSSLTSALCLLLEYSLPGISVESVFYPEPFLVAPEHQILSLLYLQTAKTSVLLFRGFLQSFLSSCPHS